MQAQIPSTFGCDATVNRGCCPRGAESVGRSPGVARLGRTGTFGIPLSRAVLSHVAPACGLASPQGGGRLLLAPAHHDAKRGRQTNTSRDPSLSAPLRAHRAFWGVGVHSCRRRGRSAQPSSSVQRSIAKRWSTSSRVSAAALRNQTCGRGALAAVSDVASDDVRWRPRDDLRRRTWRTVPPSLAAVVERRDTRLMHGVTLQADRGVDANLV